MCTYDTSSRSHSGGLLTRIGNSHSDSNNRKLKSTVSPGADKLEP